MNWQNWFARNALNAIMWTSTFKGRRIKKTPASLGMQYEDITFLSRGSLILLRGWLCPSRSSHVIILAHGGLGNRQEIINLADKLVIKGYNVFLFDFRGHGKSEGSWNSQSFGKEFEDVLGAFDYLSKVRGFTPGNIGLWGFSLGATASLIAAAREEKIKAVIADSSYAEFETVLKRKSGHPKDWRLRYFAFFLKWCFEKSGIQHPNLIEMVSGTQAKLFFIHREKDEVIPSDEFRRLFVASGGNERGNEIWIIKGASHCQVFQPDLDEYTQMVVTFLEKHL